MDRPSLRRSAGDGPVPALREETVQRMLAMAARAVPRWNPEIATWSTYGGDYMKWELVAVLTELREQREQAMDSPEFERIAAHRGALAGTAEVEEAVEDSMEAEAMGEAFGQLPVEDQHLLTARLGLNGADPKSYAEIARTMSMSPGAVSRRTEKAMERLSALLPNSYRLAHT